jgi:ribosomal protein S18 acetylase RimI-like enzyme
VTDPFRGPAVLRCGRCGRIAGWDDARVQIVCGCRPRLELPPPFVREASDADRPRALDIFNAEFGDRQLVAAGQPVSVEDGQLLVGETEGGIAGALAWRQLDGVFHIIALATDPLWQRSGLGATLLAEAELLAKRQSLTRVLVTITNDNIPALYFYQRRGYRISAVLRDSVASHERNRNRIGFAEIPIRDEVQLTKDVR